MSGRRTNSGYAVVGLSSHAGVQRKMYFVESRSAYLRQSGKIEPASIILYNKETGAPLQCISFDRTKRLLSQMPDSRSITIVLANDSRVEIQCEEEGEIYRWAKHIGLLLTIPRYVIPEEPEDSMFLGELWNYVDPKFYHPLGVVAWGVGTVDEGVGKAAGLRNAHCVAVVTKEDKLLVFPWKVTTPMLVWNRKHVRRSGNVGHLTFLEGGRQCSFGPGLLWMHSKSSVMPGLSKGMHLFIFKGWQAFKMGPEGKRMSDSLYSIVSPRDDEGRSATQACYEGMRLPRLSSDSRSDSGLGKSFRDRNAHVLVQPGSVSSEFHDSYGSDKDKRQRVNSGLESSLEDSLSGLETSLEDFRLSQPGYRSRSASLQEPNPNDPEYVEVERNSDVFPEDDCEDLYVPMRSSTDSMGFQSCHPSPSYPKHQHHLLGTMRGPSRENPSPRSIPRHALSVSNSSSTASIYDNHRLSGADSISTPPILTDCKPITPSPPYYDHLSSRRRQPTPGP